MNNSKSRHEIHMAAALALAQTAWLDGDWPVGTVIVRGEAVISAGRGRQNTSADPTAHAETEALREARWMGTDLHGATIYCTMEPCPMCAHALHLHGIAEVVLGARHADLRRSDLGSYNLERLAQMMGYRFAIINDVAREECVALRRKWGGDPT